MSKLRELLREFIGEESDRDLEPIERVDGYQVEDAKDAIEVDS